MYEIFCWKVFIWGDATSLWAPMALRLTTNVYNYNDTSGLQIPHQEKCSVLK